MKRPSSTPGRPRDGFTLLEVILSLAILAGAVATLGELIRSGLANAQSARDFTRAKMLCEGIEEQVVAGAISPSGSSGTCDDDPRWLYSISSESDQPGLLNLQITVSKDVPPDQHTVQFTLWRWMIDPNIASESNDTTDTSSSTGTGSTSGTGTGG
ncbi:MAG TPA: prepilin-type N-terminal cleavage/methylation domain-containing protein [Pirellulales bacterium]|jgi:prepilin-type N-terminal cleavage/methylation domain-containing protein|nr:prepilin-type N-terminal cleavage/methylation domain-containing protein [Pirellulales bacterium]